MPDLTTTWQSRFWSKVEKTGTCWHWIGAIGGTGYGNFWLDGRTVRPHRLSYAALVGPIPKGLDLDHLCRNRNCVNPDHLEPVTRRENTIRGSSPSARAYVTATCTKGHPRGQYERCSICEPERRATKYDIEFIRAVVAKAELTGDQQASREYGVPNSTVRYWRKRHSTVTHNRPVVGK